MWVKYKKYLQIIGITLAVFLGIKYLLPVVAPFLIACIIVRMVYPLTARIEKRLHIKKDWVTLVILLIGLVLLLTVLWFLGVNLCKQIRSVITHFEDYEQHLELILDNCCQTIQRILGLDGEAVRQYLVTNVSQAGTKLESYLAGNLFDHSMEYVMAVLKFLGIFFVIFIAVLLLIKDYDEILKKASVYQGYQKFRRIMKRLWKMGGDYLKAQGTIMLIVMVICVIGLWLIKNQYALLAGILIGLLDALPFIGTGVIFIPLAIFKLLQGQFLTAVAYAILFLAANTAREFLEPRLVGNKLGVYPIFIAMAVYAGIFLYGVAGVILGPITLLIVQQCVRELEE